MSLLWLVILPFALAAGWYGEGSKPDRVWTTIMFATFAASAFASVWRHEYGSALVMAGIMLVVGLAKAAPVREVEPARPRPRFSRRRQR